MFDKFDSFLFDKLMSYFYWQCYCSRCSKADDDKISKNAVIGDSFGKPYFLRSSAIAYRTKLMRTYLDPKILLIVNKTLNKQVQNLIKPGFMCLDYIGYDKKSLNIFMHSHLTRVEQQHANTFYILNELDTIKERQITVNLLPTIKSVLNRIYRDMDYNSLNKLAKIYNCSFSIKYTIDHTLLSLRNGQITDLSSFDLKNDFPPLTKNFSIIEQAVLLQLIIMYNKEKTKFFDVYSLMNTIIQICSLYPSIENIYRADCTSSEILNQIIEPALNNCACYQLLDEDINLFGSLLIFLSSWILDHAWYLNFGKNWIYSFISPKNYFGNPGELQYIYPRLTSILHSKLWNIFIVFKCENVSLMVENAFDIDSKNYKVSKNIKFWLSCIKNLSRLLDKN